MRWSMYCFPADLTFQVWLMSPLPNGSICNEASSKPYAVKTAIDIIYFKNNCEYKGNYLNLILGIYCKHGFTIHPLVAVKLRKSYSFVSHFNRLFTQGCYSTPCSCIIYIHRCCGFVSDGFFCKVSSVHYSEIILISV